MTRATGQNRLKIVEPPNQQTISHAQGVALRAVTKKYGNIVAIENITLDVAAGSYCCLLGPSGCGKTTTLRLIAGHEEITSGNILIGDRCVNSLLPMQRNTAMVFQNYALFPHKTVWENIEFGLKMQRVSVSDRTQRVNEMIELMGLSNFAKRKPQMLTTALSFGIIALAFAAFQFFF